MTAAAPLTPYTRLIDPAVLGQQRRTNAMEIARAKASSAGRPGQSEEALKAAYANYKKHKADYDALRNSINTLRAKIDDLVAAHTKSTTPLQQKLSEPNTKPDDRIAARVQVNAENNKLETAIAPLTAQIAAAEQEMHLLSIKISSGAGIENAFVKAGDQVRNERLQVLEHVGNMLSTGPLFVAQKKCDDRHIALENVKAAQKEQGHPDRAAFAEAERMHRFAIEVEGILSKWASEMMEERDTIRQSRLAELRGN